MSLESLLGQFDTLADRSTNIAGIRKLLIINVIKRATSRKGFLDRAVEVKASLTPQTKTKAGKSTGTRNQDLALPEVLLKIPADAFARLGDVAEIEKGLTAIQKSIPGSYPLVVTAEARSTNATFDFEGPAVVIPMVSSTGHGHASLKRIHYQEGKFAAGNILSVVKPKRPDILNTRFLFEYLTAFKEELLVSRMVGTANVSLTINGLRDIPIPLIQGEDVAKVDELMALCDRLEAQLKERDIKQAALAKAALAKFTEDPTPENLQLLFHPSFLIEPEDLKKIVLHLAIKGKLSTGSAKDSPASQAFQQLQKFSSTSSKERSPDRWIVVRLGHLGEWRGGGTPSKSRPDYWAGTLPWVSPKDMKVLKIADAQDHISPAAVEGSSVRLIPSGSLLMVVRGMILARCFPVAVTTREVTINQDMKALTPHYPEMKDYILIALRSLEKTVLDCIEHSTHGTCKLQTEPLQNTLIPIPPPEEQKRIVEKTEQLLSLIDQLEAKIEASRTTGEKLLEAMVAELTSA